MAEDFADAALVLVGHGSTTNDQSAAATQEQAENLRRRQIFARVEECFWKHDPGVAEVLSRVSAARVFVVPFFVSEGYFTQEAIPKELGLAREPGGSLPRIQRRGGQTIYYCSPVGTHARMTELLLDRAKTVVAQHPYPFAPSTEQVALLVAGHGTRLNPNSRRAVERQVEIVRARGLYAEAHALFLQEDPPISAAYQIAAARYLVLVPFFLSDGLHVDEDIPVLLGERREAVEQRLQCRQPTWRNPTERYGKLLWYASSVGRDPAMAEVILERVREVCPA